LISEDLQVPSELNDEIIPSNVFLNSLHERYTHLQVPTYKFREWYSKELKIFFDCSGAEPTKCLEKVMKGEDYSHFRVFIIIKEGDGYRVMDISYPNIGNLSLRRWLERYHSQLKPASIMSLEGAGKEYIEYLGASYEE